MRICITIALVAMSLLGPGCSTTSDGVPVEESLRARDGHSQEFLWREAKTVLKEQGWHLETVDETAFATTTAWNFVQGAFSHGDFQGSRTRLEVKVVGTLMDGYSVDVKETREINTSQKSMMFEDADWEPSEADGRAASVFLFGLERRLHPPQDWRYNQQR